MFGLVLDVLMLAMLVVFNVALVLTWRAVAPSDRDLPSVTIKLEDSRSCVIKVHAPGEAGPRAVLADALVRLRYDRPELAVLLAQVTSEGRRDSVEVTRSVDIDAVKGRLGVAADGGLN